MPLCLGVQNAASGAKEICSPNSNLYLQSHPTDTFNTLINAANGRVGIGSINPMEKLSVVGDMGLSGNLRLGNLAGNGTQSNGGFCW